MKTLLHIKSEALFEKYPFLLKEYRHLLPLITPRIFEKLLKMEEFTFDNLNFTPEVMEEYFLPGMLITTSLNFKQEQRILSSPTEKWDWRGIVLYSRISFLKRIYPFISEDGVFHFAYRDGLTFEEGLFFRRNGCNVSKKFFEINGEITEILFHFEELGLSSRGENYVLNSKLTTETLQDFMGIPLVKKIIEAKVESINFFISNREMEWNVQCCQSLDFCAHSFIFSKKCHSSWCEAPSFWAVDEMKDKDWGKISHLIVYTPDELVSFITSHPRTIEKINWDELAEAVPQNCMGSFYLLKKKCVPYHWGVEFIKKVEARGIDTSLCRDYTDSRKELEDTLSGKVEGVNFDRLWLNLHLIEFPDIILKYRNKFTNWGGLHAIFPAIFFIRNGLPSPDVRNKYRIVEEEDIPKIMEIQPDFRLRLSEIKSIDSFRKRYRSIEYDAEYIFGTPPDNFFTNGVYDVEEVLSLVSEVFRCSKDDPRLLRGYFFDIDMIRINKNIPVFKKIIHLGMKFDYVPDCSDLSALLKFKSAEILYVEFYEELILFFGEGLSLKEYPASPNISTYCEEVSIPPSSLKGGVLRREHLRLLRECKLQ